MGVDDGGEQGAGGFARLGVTPACEFGQFAGDAADPSADDFAAECVQVLMLSQACRGPRDEGFAGERGALGGEVGAAGAVAATGDKKRLLRRDDSADQRGVLARLLATLVRRADDRCVHVLPVGFAHGVNPRSSPNRWDPRGRRSGPVRPGWGAIATRRRANWTAT